LAAEGDLDGADADVRGGGDVGDADVCVWVLFDEGDGASQGGAGGVSLRSCAVGSMTAVLGNVVSTVAANSRPAVPLMSGSATSSGWVSTSLR
jgi:hypothetical protein